MVYNVLLFLVEVLQYLPGKGRSFKNKYLCIYTYMHTHIHISKLQNWLSRDVFDNQKLHEPKRKKHAQKSPRPSRAVKHKDLQAQGL